MKYISPILLSRICILPNGNRAVLFVLMMAGISVVSQGQILRTLPIFDIAIGYPIFSAPAEESALLRGASPDLEDAETVFQKSEVEDDEEIAEWAQDIDWEAHESYEPEHLSYSDVFTLRSEAIEGIRMIGMDPHENIILIEDRLFNRLSIRIQKIRVSRLEMRFYNEGGRIVYYKDAHNLPIGTEFPFRYDKWPEGSYSLRIRVDDGDWQEKEIVKPKMTARL